VKGFGGSNECQTASYAPGAHVLARVCSPRLPSRNSGEGSYRSTQPCIPPGSLNRVSASAGVRAGMSPLPGGR